mgnify:CR=1 FL=1
MLLILAYLFGGMSVPDSCLNLGLDKFLHFLDSSLKQAPGLTFIHKRRISITWLPPPSCIDRTNRCDTRFVEVFQCQHLLKVEICLEGGLGTWGNQLRIYLSNVISLWKLMLFAPTLFRGPVLLGCALFMHEDTAPTVIRKYTQNFCHFCHFEFAYFFLWPHGENLISQSIKWQGPLYLPNPP